MGYGVYMTPGGTTPVRTSNLELLIRRYLPLERGELLYEGKAKKVYKTDSPDYYWTEFKDDATAFNGKK